MQTIDIVNLIDNNPVTNLSNNYNNKLLNKIKENFTEEQQHLFVTSFFCYLNYNQLTDFVIDLDDVWRWIGFSQKIHAKTALEKNFILDKDYKFSFSQVRERKNVRGGSNKEVILMTIKTFKLFCIKSNTKKANEIHEYYIKLEELLQETIQEQTNELREQLEEKKLQIKEKDKKIEEKDKKIEKSNIEKELLREKTILEQFANNVECIYYGYIDNTNEANEKLIKFGQSNNLKRRVTEHKKTFTNFRLVNAFRVENKQLIENAIKSHAILNKSRRNLVIDGINQIELLVISKNKLKIVDLDKYIKNIIYSNEFTTENFTNILDENIKLKEEILLFKEENDKLKIENNKMSKNYKIKMIPKIPNITLETILDNDKVLNLLKRFSKQKDGFYHIYDKLYSKLIGTRKEVWDEVAYKTTGGLTKDEFLINKEGKIVSKKKFISSKLDNHLLPSIIMRQKLIDERNLQKREATLP